MSKITLVTGGVRSGKSTFAESLFEDKDNVLYIATSLITDDEMKERVTIHKASRNQNWETLESYNDLYKAIRETECKYIMLECVTTLVSNMIFDKYTNFDNISTEQKKELENEIGMQIKKIITTAMEFDKELIMISNEVGSGLVSEYRLGRIFTDIAGRINQLIGKLCDEAYLVVAGLPLKLK